jgi:hypothetical protein
MKVDRFEKYTQEYETKPRVEWDVIKRFNPQPISDRNQGRLEINGRNDQQKTEKKGEFRFIDEKNPCKACEEYTVQNTKEHKISWKYDIGDQGDNECPRSNHIQSPLKSGPLDALFVGQCEPHADAYEKERNNESRQREPKGIFSEFNLDKVESI